MFIFLLLFCTCLCQNQKNYQPLAIQSSTTEAWQLQFSTKNFYPSWKRIMIFLNMALYKHRVSWLFIINLGVWNYLSHILINSFQNNVTFLVSLPRNEADRSLFPQKPIYIQCIQWLPYGCLWFDSDYSTKANVMSPSLKEEKLEFLPLKSSYHYFQNYKI